MSSQARKQRRMYERYLKKANPTAYKQYKSQSAQRGKEIHQEHLNNVLLENDKANAIKSEDFKKSVDILNYE